MIHRQQTNPMRHTIRTSLLLLTALLALIAFAPPAFAETAATSAGDALSAPTKPNWALAVIPVATPILISLIRWAAPKTPKVALPILAPLLGATLDIVIYLAGGQTQGTLSAALLGMAGVCVREAVDQATKLLQA